MEKLQTEQVSIEYSEYFRHGINFGLYIIALFLSISISITQIGLGIVLLCWLLLMICERKIIIASTPLNKPVLFFVAAELISAIFGINLLHSLIAIKELWVTLIFFSMMTFIQDQEMIKRLIYSLFAGASIASIYGISQRLTGGLDLFRPQGEKIIQYAYLQYPNEVLSIGFFHHHLTYAEVLLFPACLSLSLFLMKLLSNEKISLKKNCREVAIYLGVFLITSMALFYSFARGSWIGFLGGLFFILLFLKRKAAITIGVTTILFLTAFATFHTPVRNRILSTFHQTDRLYIWKTALDIIRDHPLTGMGVDTWQEGVSPYFNYYIENKIYKFSDTAVTQHAHNNILHQTSMLGIIGLSAFIYIWFVLFREGIKCYYAVPKNQETVKSIIIGGLSGIVSFHVAGLFEATYEDSEVIMTHWFIAGLVFCAAKLSMNGDKA